MFYQAAIESIEQMTSDSVNIRLSVAPELNPGFKYLAGQYLVIRIPSHDPAEHRSYSLSEAPSENILQIGVKRLVGGNISTYLCTQAKKGDVVELMAPQGTFLIPPSSNIKNIVAFAAGSGITPIMAMIKTVLSSDQDAVITLFYGNKDAESTMYRQDLANLTNLYVSRFECINIYSQQRTGLADLEGRISPEKVSRWSQYLFSLNNTDLYLICGPGSMVSDLEKHLIATGVEKSKILTELFTSPVEDNPAIDIQANVLNSDFLIKVKFEKKLFEISAHSNDSVILDLGIKSGLDLPYSCKSGVCSTCQAKLISGEVRMDNNYVLSDSELKQGFILTCQSHALTPIVEVDYDMK